MLRPGTEGERPRIARHGHPNSRRVVVTVSVLLLLSGVGTGWFTTTLGGLVQQQAGGADAITLSASHGSATPSAGPSTGSPAGPPSVVPSPERTLGTSGWSSVCDPCSPGALSNASMVYDPAGPYVLLFGGSAGGVPQSPTWTFSGGTWTEVCAACGPSARYGAAMTYDYRDGYVLLFGGMTSGGPVNDTWSFRSGSWSELCSSCGPSPRYGASMTFDTPDNEVVLVGGCGVSTCPLDDSWSFGIGTWARLCGTCAFPAREGASLAYDPTDGYVVLFGGEGASGELNDTWKYELATWTSICTLCAPSYRFLAPMTNDSEDGYLLLFGGGNASSGTGQFGDTWEFVDGGWDEIHLASSPSPREAAMMADDPADHEVLLFAGSAGSDLSDAWSYDYGMSAATPSGSPAQVENGQTVSFTASASGGHPAYTFLWQGLPPGCSSANVTSLSCTPSGVLANTTFPVQVRVSDTQGNAVLSAALSYEVLSNPALPIIVPSVPSGHLDSGQTVLFAATARGGTGSYSFVWSGLPSACPAANLRVIRCTPTGLVANRTYSILVNITDSQGIETVGVPLVFQVDVDPSITTPVASSTTVESGQFLNLSTLGFGGGGGYDFIWIGTPSGCPTVDTPDLSCVLGAYTFNTTDTLSVSLTDANGLTVASSSITISIIVGPTISPPHASPSTIDSGQSVLLKVIVGGGVGGYQFTWNGLPPGCSSSDTPDLLCTPSPTTLNATYPISVTMEDANHQSVVSGSLLLNLNADTTLTPIAITPSSVDSDALVSFEVAASGGAGGYHFTWTGLPPGCSTFNSPRWSCRPSSLSSNATFLVGVTVRDAAGFNVTSPTVDLEVRSTLEVSPPTASPSGIDAGEITTLQVKVLGGDGDYTFLWSGLPPGCSGANAPTLECRPAASATNATFSVDVNVTDGLGFSVNSPALALGVDAAPAILSIEAAASPVDLDGSLTLTATFEGGDGPYTFHWSGVPPGCPASGGAVETCSPLALGTFVVNATLEDSRGVSGGGPGTTVTVVKAPSILSFSPSRLSIELGQNATFSARATGGVAPYSYLYSGLPSGCISLNLPAIVCTPLASGDFDIGVNVTDQRGSVAHSSFVWIVTPRAYVGQLFGLPSTEAYLLIGGLVAAVVVVALVVVPLVRGDLFAPVDRARSEDEEEDGEGEGFPEGETSPGLAEEPSPPEEAPAETEPEPRPEPSVQEPASASAPPMAEPEPGPGPGPVEEADAPTAAPEAPAEEAHETAPVEAALPSVPEQVEPASAEAPQPRCCPFCQGPLRNGSYCPQCDVDFSQLRIEGRTDTLKKSERAPSEAEDPP